MPQIICQMQKPRRLVRQINGIAQEDEEQIKCIKDRKLVPQNILIKNTSTSCPR